jgi:hypothetical protein
MNNAASATTILLLGTTPATYTTIFRPVLQTLLQLIIIQYQ